MIKAAHTQPDLPRSSPRLLRMFARYCRFYVGRRFNAIRLLRGDAYTLPAGQPVVFYVNHPSWWDPLMLILLAMERYGERRHFAPIDAAMLEKYAFFGRLGFFGVDQQSPRGAARLLRTADAILSHDDAALWITAEGQFTDVRQRPVTLRPGLAHIARRMTHGYIVPLALEYPFWFESTPEALLAMGAPINASAPEHRDRSIAEWNTLLEQELEWAMDRLAAASFDRDESVFENLIVGKRGVGGIYDVWRRLKFWSRGRRFDPSHAHNPVTEGRGKSS